MEHRRDVSSYAAVRRRVYVEGWSERAAARRVGLARETVRTMLRSRLPPGYRRQLRCPKLEAFTGVIDQILRDDGPKKQRHPATRLGDADARRTPHGRRHDRQSLRARAEAGGQAMFVPLAHGRRPGRRRRSAGGHRRRRTQGARPGRGSAAQRRRREGLAGGDDGGVLRSQGHFQGKTRSEWAFETQRIQLARGLYLFPDEVMAEKHLQQDYPTFAADRVGHYNDVQGRASQNRDYEAAEPGLEWPAALWFWLRNKLGVLIATTDELGTAFGDRAAFFDARLQDLLPSDQYRRVTGLGCRLLTAESDSSSLDEEAAGELFRLVVEITYHRPLR